MSREVAYPGLWTVANGNISFVDAVHQHAEVLVNELKNLFDEFNKEINTHAELVNDHDSLLVDNNALKEEYNKLKAFQTNYNTLQAEHATLQTQIHHLQTNPSAAITELQQKIATLEATNTSLMNQHHLPQYLPRLSAEHPDPDTFSGVNKELPSFIRAMYIKLKRNADWYPTDQDKMAYLVSRLRGKAHDTVQYGISLKGDITFANIDAIVTVLQQTYGDIDEEGTAQTKLMNLKQGNKPTLQFLSEWQDIANKSGLEDKSLIAFLKNSLHHEVLNRLSTMLLTNTKISPDLTGFITQIRHIDSVLRSLSPDYTKAKTHTHHTPQFVTPLSDSTSLSVSQGGDAMDLNAARLSASWGPEKRNVRPANDEERAARKLYNLKNNLCLWCDSPDHRAKVCPTAPWNKKTEQKAPEGKAKSLA
jgi:hypothetical protein